MIPLVSIGLFLTGLFWLALVLWRFPAHIGIYVLAAVVIIDSTNLWTTPIDIGLFIGVDDIACVILIAVVAVLAIKEGGLPERLCLPALILLGIAGMNLLRGVPQYGIKSAGNGIRYLVFFIVPFLALTAIGPKLRFNFSRATACFSGAAFLFAGIAIGRWTGILPLAYIEEDFRPIPRVMGADFPMIIGQALILVIGFQLSRGVRVSGMLKAVLFGGVVLLMQHRSVWAATAVGLVWLALQSLRSASLRQWVQFAATSAAIVAVAALLLVASGRTTVLSSLLKVNFDEARQQDSTFEWRMDGFSEAIDRTFASGTADMLFGPPSGTGEALAGIASKASLHIHNRYIDTLAYYGVSGLLLLVAWFWMVAARIWRISSPTAGQRRGGMRGPILQAILLSEFTYFLAYFGDITHGAVIGLLWVASAESLDPQPLPAVAQPARTASPNPAYAGMRS